LIFSSIFGSQASITCKSKSASIESSKVEVKASISSGGKSRINQIVSFIKYSLHLKLFFSVASTHIFQTEVQSVANSLSSAKTHFFVREFVKVANQPTSIANKSQPEVTFQNNLNAKEIILAKCQTISNNHKNTEIIISNTFTSKNIGTSAIFGKFQNLYGIYPFQKTGKYS